ncbi:MAG: OsmC family protein [Lentisphaerae bacterium]|nr:OsmC family protein [Lentisphaerota bacterium]
MKDITVTFPGGKRVDAHYNGRTVQTDQSVRNGGRGAAPEPFDLFFVSIATCVGIYVLEFCNTRHLDTGGLGVRLRAERNEEKKLYSPIRIELTLPAGFPAKYRTAILRTANLCTVKKHIMNPPEFDVVLADTAEA